MTPKDPTSVTMNSEYTTINPDVQEVEAVWDINDFTGKAIRMRPEFKGNIDD